MEFDWIEAIGFAGTGFTIVAYGMRNLIPLRIAAILSSVAFLTYGLLTQSYPLLLMEVVLLPINIFRLLELRPYRRSVAPLA
ncbi:MAG TPA: YgjV family protein [Devosia sp.]|nr:YgjV family protein [Devosia sp.]